MNYLIPVRIKRGQLWSTVYHLKYFRFVTAGHRFPVECELHADVVELVTPATQGKINICKKCLKKVAIKYKNDFVILKVLNEGAVW